MQMNKNILIESILTAMIKMALSKNPNPTNGIALWNATDERKPKNMSEILLEFSTKHWYTGSKHWLHSGGHSTAYLSNRPQVSMGYRLINHSGCCQYTRRIRKSRAANNSKVVQFFHEFTSTANHSWLTNQSACIDLVIIWLRAAPGNYPYPSQGRSSESHFIYKSCRLTSN